MKSYGEERDLRLGLARSEVSAEERAWNARVASKSNSYVEECSRRAEQLAIRRAEYQRVTSRPWLSPRDPGDDWVEPSEWPESLAAPTLSSDHARVIEDP
jgi:hypothetical protein